MHAPRDQGVSIPEEAAVISFDEPPPAGLANPGY
jgi:hypothetical protein